MRPITLAFDRGQRPTVVCVNRSTVNFEAPIEKIASVLQVFLDKHFAPIWGTPAKVVVDKKVWPGAWALIFVDNPDVADALGYHDLTEAGMPQSFVFSKLLMENYGQVTSTASHELAEMLVDPAIQLGAEGPQNAWWAYEVADAVEQEYFQISGLALTDFVYPSWFESFRKPGSTQFDKLKKCDRPFQILPGGYMPIYQAGRWTQIFGSRGQRFDHAEHGRLGQRHRRHAKHRV